MFLGQATSRANFDSSHTQCSKGKSYPSVCKNDTDCLEWTDHCVRIPTVFIKCDFAKYCFKKWSSLSIIKTWNSHSHQHITQFRILYIRYIIILYIRFLQLCGRTSYSGIQLWNVFSITKSNKTLEDLIKSVHWSQRKCVCLPRSLTN